jgi:hypothetical protein
MDEYNISTNGMPTTPPLTGTEGVSAGAQERSPKPRRSKMMLWLALAVIIIAAIVATVIINPGGVLDNVVPDGANNSASVVAVVNGQELNRSELDARVSQARSILEAQGATFDTVEKQNELENLSLENLINETLLIQEPSPNSLVGKRHYWLS